MNEINKALEALKDEDGENRAVRAFLMIYGTPGLTAAAMAAHMRRSGFDYVPAWVERSPEFLTKAGAQLWLRMLFALENPAAPVPGDAPPKPDREDARRYCHPGFQEWLDESVTENGEHTVFDLLSSVHDAYSGFCASPSYPDSKYAPSAPAAGQCGESCERAKLCGACARGLEEVPEPAASEREAFESWARDQWGDRPVPNNAWLGWQGRAALAASQPDPVEDLRSDAMQDMAYANGAQAGFALGMLEDHEGLRKLIESRAGALGVLKTLRASKPAPVETVSCKWCCGTGRFSDHDCRFCVGRGKVRAAPVEAQAVPAGWSIRRTPGKAEIGITTPEDGPGGMFVSPSDRDLARRVLYALCESLSASNQNGGE
jgi:hypothetical protein